MRIKNHGMRAAMVGLVAGCFAAVASAGDTTVKVKVAWDGKPYKAKEMKEMNPECKGFHGDQPARKESVVTNENGTLANVFVYVKNAPAGDYKAPTTPVVLDQKGCVYVPHVFGVMVGQNIEIRNSDPTAHNIHFTPSKNPEFNKSQPKKDLVETLVLKRAEVMVPIKCDVHPWMSAFAGVMEHPFFGTTAADGTVTIKGLPGGTFELVSWHETYGEKTQSITVATGETKEVEFKYSRSDKKEGDE